MKHLKTSSTTESVLLMTYEENGVRHLGGYMVRNLSQKFTREKEDELEALKDLRGDEMEEAEESEEWH